VGSPLNCYFLDERADFFSVLNSKLGKDFSFVPVSTEVLGDAEELAACDVIIVGISRCDPPACNEQIALLEKAALNAAGVPALAFLRGPDRALMREAFSAGAFDCFPETGPMEELRIVLRRATQFHALAREMERLRQSAHVTDFGTLVGTDPRMLAMMRLATKVAQTDATVLINGETGTGKELVARAMHQASPRAGQPFVAVACSSLPESLIEAELFGHEKGAFTGAISVRRGRCEIVGRGTLFLDEIGELSPALQVKLLRVLQERTFERLGSNESRPMQARVICATNRDLRALTLAGQFRADLFYRLNTIAIEVPPLRERREDIILLACTFLQEFAKRHGRPARRLSPAACCALRRYPWPGNVRELQHAIEHAVVLSDGPDIWPDHLPREVAYVKSAGADHGNDFESDVRTFKRHLIEKVLVQTKNNKAQAARSMRISRSSLNRMIDELGVRTTEKKLA
jgi:two-component system response regulator AtoC